MMIRTAHETVPTPTAMRVLRRLDLDELDALVTLEHEGAVTGLSHIFPQETYPFPVPAVRARWLATISSDETRCFAIDEGSGLAGYAALRGNELVHFGTAVPTWGTGLADRAHEEVVHELRRTGKDRAWLRCLEGNVRAVRFYTRRGWVPSEETSPSPFAPGPTLRTFVLDLRPLSPADPRSASRSRAAGRGGAASGGSDR